MGKGRGAQLNHRELRNLSKAEFEETNVGSVGEGLVLEGPNETIRYKGSWGISPRRAVGTIALQGVAWSGMDTCHWRVTACAISLV